jgi:methylmalonyl-CoA/ethylmalonyl-CoA epimerase
LFDWNEYDQFLYRYFTRRIIMTVNEIRVALTTEEFDQVVSFYRDGLGLDPGDVWEENGARGQMFLAGRGTLEVFEPDYAKHIDSIEVGQPVSGQIRFAFEVPDVHQALSNALEYGAALVAEPKLTSWGDFNARVLSPDGLQVTLFEVNIKQEDNIG